MHMVRGLFLSGGQIRRRVLGNLSRRDGGWVWRYDAAGLAAGELGFGVGGLYCVDLPLVQEFMPASKRGFIGGLVTAFIPIAVMICSLLGGYLTPSIGWRGLLWMGILPALVVLFVRRYVKEPPIWLENRRQQRAEGGAG